MKSRGWKGTVLLAAASGVLVTLGLCAVYHRPLISHGVTCLAFRDAESWAREVNEAGTGAESRRAAERCLGRLVERYGPFFRRGFFDRQELVRRFQWIGPTEEAVAPCLVLSAYYMSDPTWFSNPGPEAEAYFAELREWLDPVLASPGSKELLVKVLTSPWTVLPSGEDEDTGLGKRELFLALFSEGKEEPLLDLSWSNNREITFWREKCLGAVTGEHWQAILRHSDHPREKVRAGSILLLYSHPSREVFLERARRGLSDTSTWVRLAAAGLLAMRGEKAGERELYSGLDHDRWEVRFWCTYGLHSLGRREYAARLREREPRETDPFVLQALKTAVERIEKMEDP